MKALKVWGAHFAIVACAALAVLAVALRVPPLPATSAWMYGAMAAAAWLSFLVSRGQGRGLWAAVAVAAAVAALAMLASLGLVLNIVGA
ncbi:hypothetical protein [Lysobacter enzymogenes]|uniref:hypothetical protein n=1 Tax=Lysobacter enzymogenes TaxID=69 RepID=UPI00089A9909|nr:hypothetical protein [Lysobacter enzymogenes]SDY29207.1 hypothetical protein SAMN05421681_11641 [Lysobacter enzymogenes]